MLQEIPLVEYGFLEELLKILGKPNQTLFRVHEEESTLDNILIEESYSVRKCECDVETILEVYKKTYNKDRNCELYLDSLRWSEESLENRKFEILLSAKFTPHEFSLKIDVSKKEEKFKKLIDLLKRYRIRNNIIIQNENKL